MVPASASPAVTKNGSAEPPTGYTWPSPLTASGAACGRAQRRRRRRRWQARRRRRPRRGRRWGSATATASATAAASAATAATVAAAAAGGRRWLQRRRAVLDAVAVAAGDNPVPDGERIAASYGMRTSQALPVRVVAAGADAAPSMLHVLHAAEPRSWARCAAGTSRHRNHDAARGTHVARVAVEGVDSVPVLPWLSAHRRRWRRPRRRRRREGRRRRRRRRGGGG